MDDNRSLENSSDARTPVVVQAVTTHSPMAGMPPGGPAAVHHTPGPPPTPPNSTSTVIPAIPVTTKPVEGVIPMPIDPAPVIKTMVESHNILNRKADKISQDSGTAVGQLVNVQASLDALSSDLDTRTDNIDANLSSLTSKLDVHDSEVKTAIQLSEVAVTNKISSSETAITTTINTAKDAINSTTTSAKTEIVGSGVSSSAPTLTGIQNKLVSMVGSGTTTTSDSTLTSIQRNIDAAISKVDEVWKDIVGVANASDDSAADLTKLNKNINWSRNSIEGVIGDKTGTITGAISNSQAVLQSAITTAKDGIVGGTSDSITSDTIHGIQSHITSVSSSIIGEIDSTETNLSALLESAISQATSANTNAIAAKGAADDAKDAADDARDAAVEAKSAAISAASDASTASTQATIAATTAGNIHTLLTGTSGLQQLKTDTQRLLDLVAGGESSDDFGNVVSSLNDITETLDAAASILTDIATSSATAASILDSIYQTTGDKINGSTIYEIVSGIGSVTSGLVGNPTDGASAVTIHGIQNHLAAHDGRIQEVEETLGDVLDALDKVGCVSPLVVAASDGSSFTLTVDDSVSTYKVSLTDGDASLSIDWGSDSPNTVAKTITVYAVNKTDENANLTFNMSSDETWAFSSDLTSGTLSLTSGTLAEVTLTKLGSDAGIVRLVAI